MAAYLVPFMVLDGLLLYGVIAMFAVLALISMEFERPGTCTIVLIAALVVVQYCSNLDPFSFIWHHPMHALIATGAYFAAGSGWIILKWVSRVYQVRDRFNEVRDELIANLKSSDEDRNSFLRNGREADTIPPSKYFNVDGSLTSDGKARIYSMGADRIHERQLPLQVSQHKAEIYTWWICWPLSLFWTLLHDPITRLYNYVYNLFGSFMQNISNRSIELR